MAKGSTKIKGIEDINHRIRFDLVPNQELSFAYTKADPFQEMFMKYTGEIERMVKTLQDKGVDVSICNDTIRSSVLTMCSVVDSELETKHNDVNLKITNEFVDREEYLGEIEVAKKMVDELIKRTAEDIEHVKLLRERWHSFYSKLEKIRSDKRESSASK